jgi:lipopolysaccharide export system protein LptC
MTHQDPAIRIGAASAAGAERLAPERLAKAMDGWRRRSRMIRFWRIALPALMVLIALSVLGLVMYRTVFSGRRSAAQDQQIRMLTPKYFGRDKSGRPYTVTAKDAVRADPKHFELITLTTPHLILNQINGDPPTTVDSAIGVYNENTHILSLTGHVTLNNGKGDIFRSEHAIVDSDAGTVDGRSPVVGDGPEGHTEADAYQIFDSGDHIVFIGHVKTHMINQ